MIPIYQPYLPKESIDYAQEALHSGWISSRGKYVQLATEKLLDYVESKYAILTNSGTAATHLTTKCLKKFHPEVKRILVPSACYVAPYNTIEYDNNDWDVRAVDLDEYTWNMDIKNYPTSEGDAIFVVHNLGNIVNIPKLKEQHKCPIIEDNCEGFFGSYGDHTSGTQSLCSALSFFGNKNITTGEGGAFLTNNRDVYEYANHIHNQAQSAERYIHDDVGYNYRMTNIQAAILLGQLENYDYILENKMRVFERYTDNLKDVDAVYPQEIEEDTQHSMWMFGVRFHNMGGYSVAKRFFDGKGIDTRPMFYSYAHHSHLNHIVGRDDVANVINSNVVVFPSYPELTQNDIDYVCSSIKEFSESLNV